MVIVRPRAVTSSNKQVQKIEEYDIERTREQKRITMELKKLEKQNFLAKKDIRNLTYAPETYKFGVAVID